MIALVVVAQLLTPTHWCVLDWNWRPGRPAHYVCVARAPRPGPFG